MKKLMSVVLALCMALALCATAWAEGETNVADPVAKIGDTGYATVSEAIKAVPDGGTVTLLKNVSGSAVGTFADTGTDKIPAKSFTLDFNGFTFSLTDPAVGSTGTQTQGFHLEKKSTGNTNVVFKNGTLNCVENFGGLFLVQNYCDLTLENMTLDGTNLSSGANYTLSNNCGNVEIKDTTIVAKEGGVAFDVYGGFGNYSDVNVKVTGNSQINGKIEVKRESTGDNNNYNTLSFESGTHNGELSVEKVTGKEDKTNVSVTGGQFSSNVTAYVPDATAVAKDESGNHYVGSDSIAAAASGGKDLTVVQGDVTLTDVPAGVTVKNNGNGNVTVNGVAVTEDMGGYTVPQPHHHTRRQPTTTTTTTTDTTTPDTTTTTKTDAVTSAKTFDGGIAVYGVMAVLSVAGSAVVIGKKKF